MMSSIPASENADSTMESGVDMVGAEVSPTTKSDDSSDVCVDEIECFPRQYDCRNNTIVSESYSNFEQEMASIFAKELQASETTVDQQRLCIEKQLQMTKEQYENKLSLAKLMIKQMNYHHHLQEQKYMNEIHTVLEHFNRSEQALKAQMSSLSQQFKQQQISYEEKIIQLKEEIEKNNSQNHIYARETQTSVSNFERARVELNEMIQSNQIIFQGYDEKISNQSNELLTLRADLASEKEETELMVQSWMNQCESLQQEVQDIRSELTTTNNSIQEAVVTQNEIQVSIQKMGQTYENVLENVMEQIQEQTDIQSNNFNQLQNTQNEIQQQLEQANNETTEKVNDVHEKLAMEHERVTSAQTQNEKLQGALTTLEQSLAVTDKRIDECKDLLKESNDKQAATNSDLHDLQSIVAKLADASNSRFVRMETSLDDEMKSVKETKQTLLSELESYEQRVKSVDNKMVIHSIQLGEMSKEIKDAVQTVTSIKEDQQKKIEEIHNEQLAVSDKIKTNNENQLAVNVLMNDQTTKLETSLKDLEMRSTVTEKIIDTMTVRMDQFDDEHTKTRGSITERHQNIETSVSEQLKQIAQQIRGVEKISQKEVRDAADTIERKLKDQQGKLDQHEATISKLRTQTQTAESTLQDHSKKNQIFESNVANLLKDINDIKQNVKKIDQNHTSKVNEHVEHTKNQFHKIINIVLPEQLESQKMLRVRVIESENRMKERLEKSCKVVTDKVDQVQESIKTMNTAIEALQLEQNSAKAQVMTALPSIEKIAADVDAVNQAFTLETTNIMELKSKLCDVESSLETQTSNFNQFKSTTDTRITDVRKIQDQSTKDMNHSLSQVLSLSQMKEMMMKQINDSLTRLNELEATAEEHKVKVLELHKAIGEHDVKLDTISNERQSNAKHFDNLEESSKNAIDSLSLDIQKQHEIQKGVNDYISQSIASVTRSISDLDKRTSSLTTNLDGVMKSVSEHIGVYNDHVTEMKSVLNQNRDEQVSCIDELKSKLERHGDRLKTAKDARIVIRSDLKKLVESMNEQFDQLRKQIDDNKTKIEEQVVVIEQTREIVLNNEENKETLSKIDYLAGKLKAVNENAKSITATIGSLKEDIEQWTNKSEQEMTSHVQELSSKIEYLAGKFKSMNESSKSANKSIALIQGEIELYKSDKVDNEKTTQRVDEISTKIDYLAGKFKSLSENSKEANKTISSLQDQVQQLNVEHGSQIKQLDTRVTEQEQQVVTSKLEINSIQKNNNNLYESLLAEFNELKVSFDEIKTEAQMQSTTANNNDNNDIDRGNLESKVELLMQQIDTIVQQVQNLESEKRSVKAIDETLTETITDQRKGALEQQVVVESHSMKQSRQVKYNKNVTDKYGEDNELVSVTPTVKNINNAVFQAKIKNEDEEIYFESRDVEEMVSPSCTEQRD